MAQSQQTIQLVEALDELDAAAKRFSDAANRSSPAVLAATRVDLVPMYRQVTGFKVPLAPKSLTGLPAAMSAVAMLRSSHYLDQQHAKAALRATGVLCVDRSVVPAARQLNQAKDRFKALASAIPYAQRAVIRSSTPELSRVHLLACYRHVQVYESLASARFLWEVPLRSEAVTVATLRRVASNLVDCPPALDGLLDAVSQFPSAEVLAYLQHTAPHPTCGIGIPVAGERQRGHGPKLKQVTRKTPTPIVYALSQEQCAELDAGMDPADLYAMTHLPALDPADLAPPGQSPRSPYEAGRLTPELPVFRYRADHRPMIGADGVARRPDGRLLGRDAPAPRPAELFKLLGIGD